MKAFLGALGFLGGFAVSLGMFAIGVVTATWFLATEPVLQTAQSSDMDRLWTISPRKVDVASQNLERLPAAQQAVSIKNEAPQGIDPTTTAAVDNSGKQDRLGSDVNFAAHVEWCERRYRSYRPNDNSYTSYAGDDRPCISPYFDDLLKAQDLASGQSNVGDQSGVDGNAYLPATEQADELPAYDDGSQLPTQYAADASEVGAFDPSHVSDCFARFRTYRPEDNSYQPYGGGPRQQCY